MASSRSWRLTWLMIRWCIAIELMARLSTGTALQQLLRWWPEMLNPDEWWHVMSSCFREIWKWILSWLLPSLVTQTDKVRECTEWLRSFRTPPKSWRAWLQWFMQSQWQRQLQWRGLCVKWGGGYLQFVSPVPGSWLFLIYSGARV